MITSDAIKGNFIAYLREFDETLNHHLQFGKNCRYTSKTIQNQLLGIIREEITVDIRSDNIFFFHNCR